MDTIYKIERDELQLRIPELSESERLVCRTVRVDPGTDTHSNGQNLQVLVNRLSCGVMTKCDFRELASTMSGTTSSIVRAPSSRMFISNSSCRTTFELTASVYRTRQTHPEDLDGLFDAFLAVRAERVQERPANADSLRAKCNRLEDVTCAAHASVHVDLELGIREVAAQPERRDDLDEDLDAGASRVELATTMVGEHNSLNTGLVRQHSVLGRSDALQDDRHCQDARVSEHTRKADKHGDILTFCDAL